MDRGERRPAHPGTPPNRRATRADDRSARRWVSANGTTRIRAARQVRPSAVAAPTACGVTRPTPAAAAFASVSAGRLQPAPPASTGHDAPGARWSIRSLRATGQPDDRHRRQNDRASSAPEASDPAPNRALPAATASPTRRAGPHRPPAGPGRRRQSRRPPASICDCKPATQLLARARPGTEAATVRARTAAGRRGGPKRAAPRVHAEE
jgi:hypothetical protein